MYLKVKSVHNRVFPQVDDSDSSARIVLEQIKSVKKFLLTGIETVTLGLKCFLCLQYHAFPTELSWQVLIEGYLTPLFFVHH